ncbi:hypothetical protein GCM10028794_26440 [Silanimonas algicola]
MVVAMPPMRMVQVTVDKVVDMVAMRHGLMAAAGAMHMVGGMPAAGMASGAGRGVLRIDADRMLIDVVAVHMVQVAVVQVVHVAVVLDRRVAAARAVDVGMVRVGGAGHGRRSLGIPGPR